MEHGFLCPFIGKSNWKIGQCTDPVPEIIKKITIINNKNNNNNNNNNNDDDDDDDVTVSVKCETTQLGIQHVLLVRVKTTRQIWCNLGRQRSEVGVTRDFCAWPF